MPGTTNFPTALDTFPDIAPTDAEDAVGKEHDVVHNNEAAAIAALQVKVGVDDSADATSLDARVAALEAEPPVVLHFRRDDLVASGGEQAIGAQRNFFEHAVTVVRYRDGASKDLLLSEFFVGSRAVTLADAAESDDVFSIRYWSADEITEASAFIDALTFVGDFAGPIAAGSSYSSSITITGGLTPYSLADGTGLISGSLPSGLGLSLSGDTLTLSGMSSADGDYPITLGISSDDGQLATKPIILSVVLPVYGFDPTLYFSNVSYSDSDKLASAADTFKQLFFASKTARASGKRSFEIVAVSNSFGVSYTTHGVSTCDRTFFGNNNVSASGSTNGDSGHGALYFENGSQGSNGSLFTVGTSLGAIPGNGKCVHYDVDFDAGKLWVKREGDAGYLGGGDPAAGTSPTATFAANTSLRALGGFVSNTGNQVRIRNEASEFVISLPSGFSAWE